MVEEGPASPSEEPQVTFNVKSATDSKHVLTLPLSTTVLEVKEKLSGPEYADLPVQRIRLIYSGRVLKDPDTLNSIKIKDGNTVHLVKGAASNARQNPTPQASTSTPAAGSNSSQVPTNLATGTGNNPLAGLTGARFAGFHGLPGADMFGPDGGMGPPPDADQLLDMLENPMFASQMNEAMNNPHVIQMMQNNPMIRNNPMARQMLENPELRRMLFDPQIIRSQLQMQRAFRGEGAGGFPAPGVTDTTPSDQQNRSSGPNNNQTSNTGTAQPPNPFQTGGGQGNPINPFAALFQPNAPNPLFDTPQTASPAPSGTTEPNAQQQGQPPNPLAGLFSNNSQGNQANPMQQMATQMMQNPEMMRAAIQMLSGNTGDAGAGQGNQQNPFAGLFNPFGAGSNQSPQPADNRPPEEIYADQLRQLNDMGFYEFERNVQALRRSGGSVQGAIEYLLNN